MASLVDRAERRAVRDCGSRRPVVRSSLHPPWNRDRVYVASLADEIGNDLALLPLLDRLNGQRQEFGATQSAADQHRDHRVITQIDAWSTVPRTRGAAALALASASF